MGQGADPEKGEGPQAEQPDVDQGMLQRQNPVVALVVCDPSVELLDRSRWPLDDVGEHASVREQRAGDVVQGIACVAVIKDLKEIVFKASLVSGRGGMTAVDNLRYADFGTKLPVQRHFC